MPDCGPKDRQSLSDDEIFSIIDGSIDVHGKEWILALSGGEPFLYLKRLERIIAYRNDDRFSTTVVTNGYWATNKQRAKDVLEPLVDAGLSSVALSVSRYHFDYVHPERVENAILVAQEMGLHVTVKAVIAKDSPLKFVLGAIRKAKPWQDDVLIQTIEVLPEGRASNSSDIDVFSRGNIPEGKCPAELLTIRPDGKASPCCNGAGETEALDLGDVRNNSVSEIRENIRTNPTMVKLREKGPASLLSKLPPAVEMKMRESEWVNVCHLCCEVLKHLPKEEQRTVACGKAAKVATKAREPDLISV